MLNDQRTGQIETISSKFRRPALACVAGISDAWSSLVGVLPGLRQRRESPSQRFSSLFSALRDLFNAAFVSCWSELNEDQQDELIRSIELALTSQDIAEVTQTLLNLAEFMEHSDKVRLGRWSRWSLTGNWRAGGRRGAKCPPHCSGLCPVRRFPTRGFCSPPGPPAVER